MRLIQWNRLFLFFFIFAATTQVIQVQSRGSRKTKTKLNESHSAISKSITKLIGHLQKGDHFNWREFTELLSAISIPRSINTNGHRSVRKFIEATVHDFGPNWFVGEDAFSTATPLGKVRFRNVVATFVPSSQLCSIEGDNDPTSNQTAPRIILACHYDSLHPSMVHGIRRTSKSSHKFVGATDAAVSCSLILYLAHFLTPYLEKIWANPVRSNTPTLQLVFFDGEEALLNRQVSAATSRKLLSSPVKTKSNSLYGSRHLALQWEKTALRRSRSVNSPKYRSFKSRTASLRKMPRETQQWLVNASMTVCEQYRSSSGSITDMQSSSRSEAANDTVTAVAVGRPSQGERDRRLSRSKPLSTTASATIGQLKGKLATLQEDYHTLANIKLFLLLDLLGGSSPRFFNTNLQTSKYFKRLAKTEKHLLAARSSNKKSRHSSGKPFFQTSPSFLLSLVRDDHLPFVVRNVPVVHLIPSPFPRNWHTPSDDLSSLNLEAIQRLTTVLQIFLLNAIK